MHIKIDGEKVDFNNVESLKSACGKFMKFGYSVVLVGGLLVYFISADRLVCSRLTNTCEFQSQHLWENTYKATQTMPLSDLLGAEVDAYHDKNHQKMYRVLLKMKQGESYLFNTSTNNQRTHLRRADQINTYINSQDNSLEISESRWWLLFPIPFILMGLLFGVYFPHRFKKKLKELEQQDKMHAHLKI